MDSARKYGFWMVLVIYTGILIATRDLPVFWDMYGQVKTASFFLENGFNDLLPGGNSFSDNGHLPLYPFYLAVLFKFFGFKLWVAHFSVLPFLAGALWQLQRFCRRFLPDGKVFLVLLLTLLHPAFITQTLYFSNEIAVVFFSLWLLNAILYDRSSHIALVAMLLCLLNLRGIFLCSVLLAYFVFLKKNKNGWYLLCGLLAWLAWLLLHYKITGWMFASQEIKEFRSLASPAGMFKNVLLSLWKLVDLGSVFGWAAVLLIAFKTRSLNAPLKILLLASLAAALTCIPLTNPVSNRYFLLSYVLLLPAFIYSVGSLPRKLPWLITLCFGVVLFSNNGVMYPNKYGNAWDCSLKSLPYFDLRKELDAYVEQEKIPLENVEAGFQLYFNDKYYLMNGNNREYSLLSDTEMPKADYVADSDICNNYNPERGMFLRERYTRVQNFESGAVYIRLYKKNTLP